MQLTEIFAKDVQRPIEGVIKADDVAHLGTEVDEYVLTNEAAKGLELLLEAYTNYTNANGVWISGFFGSGKSHLLKMLAHLLGDVEGDDFPRERVSESFRAKATDAFLPPLLDKADRIPAKSLLFNIDQKATLISKDQTDALLRVFVKVFDESRGYYGDQGHIARFERQLDDEGQLDAFKDAFLAVSGRDWVERRPSFGLPTVRRQVNEAYAQITGLDATTAPDILKTYQDTYSVSIEDFADEVRAWLDKQPAGHRLNFFVDEVGQFIGSNTHLMLNLQTIAESLNTKCGGRAWVFVTSQEDMDKVVGDRTKQQGNDFSKIQARFKTRVKLTSADVEEVIRKRLLEKNDKGAQVLDAVYAQESANFKTLFDFVDGAKTYRNFTDEAHFVGTYPFVSYQFPLFQAAIEGISDHNVFEGRNSSVGERSMLGVVQQVAKDIGDVEIGSLATFDAMFAGIRASLKSAAQRSIDRAERDLPDSGSPVTKLAVRLLKALFLVKYVESFQATPRNLTVLVYDRFGLDLPALSKQVQDALTLLETQTYVQRNGNVYEYLTNEEQVIEEEIKNVEIDSSEVSTRLNKILSGDVVKTSKLRYAKNGQDFPFGYKLDDQAFGQQRELSLHFITPEYPYGPEEIRMHSAGKDELRVILAPDDRVLADLRLLIKTEKYTKRKQTSSLSPVEEQILRAKATQNAQREKELVERIRRAVGRADLVINAADLTVASQDAITRIADGFQDLIARTYTQLSLLDGRTYSEQQVAGFANPDQSGMIDDASIHAFAAPADEVLSYLLQRDRLGEQVTVKKIIEHFQAKPYGWDLASIECVTAWLVGTSKITITIDSNILKRSEVASALRNTQKHSHAVVAPQKTFDQRKIAALRAFCTDFFDEPAVPKDPLELARHTSERLRVKCEELKARVSSSKYPFVTQLDAPITLLESVVGKPDDWYLTDFAIAHDLLDAKSDTIDPIQAFLGGAQRKIYDEATELLAGNASNLNYLPSGSSQEVAQLLADPQAFRGNRMTKLKAAAVELQSRIDEALVANRAGALLEINSRWAPLQTSTIYLEATDEAQHSVTQKVSAVLDRIDREDQIAVVREIANTFEERTYPAVLDQLAAAPRSTDAEGGGESAPAPAKKQTVSIKSINPPGVHGVLETEEDVDRYLDALRAALIRALNDDKRIAL
ncbi:BREX system P-loop protein BrxC [Dermacoccus nishinomiyaensis]|uniref:BREX system P-loop protein BrxC n=1 Tax=Dermacoccus nishinomiyaensis TaxID=1274 RepID=UPI0021A51F71|nr:BREX system P-loop protein BrxC [Dermacoccus nishinomiyaensis]MCT1605412.1 BREX system P-loop protein BrxC [Dermacoccus nishinomiyaensis]